MFLNHLRTNESSCPVQLERSAAELDGMGTELLLLHAVHCSLLFFYGNF